MDSDAVWEDGANQLLTSEAGLVWVRKNADKAIKTLSESDDDYRADSVEDMLSELGIYFSELFSEEPDIDPWFFTTAQKDIVTSIFLNQISFLSMLMDEAAEPRARAAALPGLQPIGEAIEVTGGNTVSAASSYMDTYEEVLNDLVHAVSILYEPEAVESYKKEASQFEVNVDLSPLFDENAKFKDALKDGTDAKAFQEAAKNGDWSIFDLEDETLYEAVMVGLYEVVRVGLEYRFLLTLNGETQGMVTAFAEHFNSSEPPTEEQIKTFTKETVEKMKEKVPQGPFSIILEHFGQVPKNLNFGIVLVTFWKSDLIKKSLIFKTFRKQLFRT